MRTEDGRLIRRCLDGEPEAFGFLVDRYRESVYAFAYSRLGNFHDAEDVTQEVFIKAYQRLRTLRRWDSFHAWIYSIASNLCKNWIRARSRRPDGEFTEDQDPKTLQTYSMDSYRDELVCESVREALHSLPEAHRQVLTLFYLGGMSTKEIARFLGTSPNTIIQRLYAARSQLKEEMLAVMRTTFEERQLPVGFTLRIVEIVKRIRIHPSPGNPGMPWGLSVATGIIIAVLSVGSHLNLPDLTEAHKSSELPGEMAVTEAGEMPVDVLRVARIPVSFGEQGNGYSGGFQIPDQQNAILMAPRGEGGEFPEEPSARLVKGMLGKIAYSPDGKTLAATVGSGIWLYDAKSMNEIAILEGKPYYAIAFSPDGKILASGGTDETVRFWDVQEQKQIFEIQEHYRVLALAFSPGGKWLATAGFEGAILLWEVDLTVPGSVEPTAKLPGTWGEVKKTELLQNFPNPFNPETWIPYRLAKDADVNIRIYDVSGRLVRNLELGHKSAGIYASRNKAAYWDGRNEDGEAAASDVYFYSMKADGDG